MQLESGASGCVASQIRQLSMALFTLYPPLWIVLVGGAGDGSRLAQTRAHDEKALANHRYELVRAHGFWSLVGRADFCKKSAEVSGPA